ncbi:hypothetical protein [Methylobacterium soli]|uniref:Ribbon-helix-helix protein, CopG family n=1 Tax=Methylobacterium soli TaxID=553447 RepID=A0A6L3SU50_9HYPH|nr:hypothetical protein [Methylobacterium soli]KAB1075947.1 hypothetical protein F6X53_24270 [Methylobacterium soli]
MAVKTSQTPKQRQKTRRDKLKLAGITRMTVEMDKTTAQILRAISVEHDRTHAQVIELGIKMARRALAEAGEHRAPRSTAPTPVTPNAALAALADQLAELQAGQDADDEPPPMRASEARAISLGLASIEVRP